MAFCVSSERQSGEDEIAKSLQAGPVRTRFETSRSSVVRSNDWTNAPYFGYPHNVAVI